MTNPNLALQTFEIEISRLQSENNALRSDMKQFAATRLRLLSALNEIAEIAELFSSDKHRRILEIANKAIGNR